MADAGCRGGGRSAVGGPSPGCRQAALLREQRAAGTQGGAVLGSVLLGTSGLLFRGGPGPPGLSREPPPTPNLGFGSSRPFY